MNLHELPRQLKLQVHLYRDTLQDDENEEVVLMSDLREIIDKNTVYISAPTLSSKIYPIKLESLIKIYFTFKRSLYSFEAKVLEQKIQGNVSLVKVEMINEIEKVQRREFFRCECTLTARYRETGYISKNIKLKPQYKIVSTKNISAGGLCFTTSKEPKKARNIEIEITLKDSKKFKLNGKIMWINSNRTFDETNYDVGVWFENISKDMREEIMNFLLNEKDKDIDKGRDKDKDKDKERGKEKDKERDREKERDKERERERDKGKGIGL